jgi:hypothetical protein
MHLMSGHFHNHIKKKIIGSNLELVVKWCRIKITHLFILNHKHAPGCGWL